MNSAWDDVYNAYEWWVSEWGSEWLEDEWWVSEWIQHEMMFIMLMSDESVSEWVSDWRMSDEWVSEWEFWHAWVSWVSEWVSEWGSEWVSWVSGWVREGDNLPPEESSSERFMHHPMTRKEQPKKKTELSPIFCLRFCSEIHSDNHMPNEFSMGWCL